MHTITKEQVLWVASLGLMAELSGGCASQAQINPPVQQINSTATADYWAKPTPFSEKGTQKIKALLIGGDVSIFILPHTIKDVNGGFYPGKLYCRVDEEISKYGQCNETVKLFNGAISFAPTTLGYVCGAMNSGLSTLNENGDAVLRVPDLPPLDSRANITDMDDKEGLLSSFEVVCPKITQESPNFKLVNFNSRQFDYFIPPTGTKGHPQQTLYRHS